MQDHNAWFSKALIVFLMVFFVSSDFLYICCSFKCRIVLPFEIEIESVNAFRTFN